MVVREYALMMMICLVTVARGAAGIYVSETREDEREKGGSRAQAWLLFYVVEWCMRAVYPAASIVCVCVWRATYEVHAANIFLIIEWWITVESLAGQVLALTLYADLEIRRDFACAVRVTRAPLLSQRSLAPSLATAVSSSRLHAPASTWTDGHVHGHGHGHVHVHSSTLYETFPLRTVSKSQATASSIHVRPHTYDLPSSPAPGYGPRQRQRPWQPPGAGRPRARSATTAQS